MSEQWYYRFMDQEMGPVNLATLRALANDGSIGADDLVRNEGESDWRSAGTVPGLLPEAADAGELMGMLELASDSPRSHSGSRSRNEQCYCRVLGVEMGPMPYDQLALLAGAGRLREQDEVRLGPDAEWITAGSIVGLFAAETVAPSPATAPVHSDLDGFELSASPSGAPAVGARSAAVEEADRVWSCRVLGQEVGPMTFEEVFEMVERGELSRTDELRSGPWAEWMPAESIVGLFPEDESSAADAGDESDEVLEDEPEDDDGYHFNFEDFVEEKSARGGRGPDRRSRGGKRREARRGGVDGGDRRTKPSPRRPRKPAEESPKSRKDVPPTPPRELPAATAPPPPPPAPRPFNPPPVPAARPVPAKAPRERRSMGNPFAGIGGALGGLFGSAGGGMSQHWKPLVIAAVLGGVAYSLYFGLPFGSSRGPEVYRETLAIWEEAKRLKESPGDWAGFRSKNQARIEQLSTELQREASSKDRLLQLMLYCHRDCLPEILKGEPNGSPRKWEEMGDYMKEAQNYVKE